MINKLVLVFQSRTFWTIVAMFVIGGIHAISSALPGAWLPTIEAVLGMLATYFHVNPSQNYMAQG